jgi:hypothetical protein
VEAETGTLVWSQVIVAILAAYKQRARSPRCEKRLSITVQTPGYGLEGVGVEEGGGGVRKTLEGGEMDGPGGPKIASGGGCGGGSGGPTSTIRPQVLPGASSLKKAQCSEPFNDWHSASD